MFSSHSPFKSEEPPASSVSWWEGESGSPAVRLKRVTHSDLVPLPGSV